MLHLSCEPKFSHRATYPHAVTSHTQYHIKIIELNSTNTCISYTLCSYKQGRTFAYLMILTSSLILTLSGTRNLVLSSIGKLFSPLYRSMITWVKYVKYQLISVECTCISFSCYETYNRYSLLWTVLKMWNLI